jgi:transposase
MPMLAELVDVVIGVDTHKHTHTAAVVLATTGGQVGELTCDTDPDGYHELLELAALQPGIRCWAIEGAGSYGAGLARYLRDQGEWVVEVERPHRPHRRHGAKSDPIDAVRAAREALAMVNFAAPKHGPERAALATLLVVRNSAVDAATDAQRQLHALVITAPGAIRARFRAQTTHQMLATAAALRLPARADLEVRTIITSLRTLARRSLTLTREAKDHTKSILEIVKDWHPELLDQFGVGPIVAATVLCAWSHPGRFRSDAAFAKLAGVAPIPANSGQITHRYRLDRSGDRQLNRALHVIAITRLQRDPTTRAYAERRRAQGKTDREIRRCLKRYIARQLYKLLEAA